ncbi:MAG: hypothetical protein GXP53_12765 [Deltaproteobacteria bacterium]|nr:hypothetical protein [Deltaproteobacteria bacterium]
MKKNFIACCIAAGLIIVAAPGIGICANLVTNGGFEQKGTEKAPAGWKILISRGTKADITFDNTQKHEGTYSYRVSIAPPGGRVALYPKPGSLKNITAGKTYEASFWIKTKDLDYNRFFLAPAARFNFKPRRIGPGSTLDLMNKLKGVTGWKKLTIKATAPAGTKKMSFNFILTKGTVWIDDIVIKEVQ